MLVKSQIKYIQSLGHKKQRDELGLFIAEGPKIVAELLQTAAVQQIYALKEWIEDNKQALRHIEVVEVSPAELDKISQLTTPNNVLAVLKKFDTNPPIEAKGKITLALDTIQDPGNMGTIIRTADWFGVDQIVCSENCADIYNPKVVQSTMGSIARMKVLYTDLRQWLSGQKEISIYAALLNGEDVTAMNKPTEGIVVIGNESKGISDEILKLVDVKITIPQKARLTDSVGQGKAESLNAAVATGIILSHIV